MPISGGAGCGRSNTGLLRFEVGIERFARPSGYVADEQCPAQIDGVAVDDRRDVNLHDVACLHLVECCIEEVLLASDRCSAYPSSGSTSWKPWNISSCGSF